MGEEFLKSDGFTFKSELMERTLFVDSAGVSHPQIISLAPPRFNAPLKTVPPKRKLRVPLHNKRIHRPATSQLSTILPHPPKVTPSAPLVPKPIPTVQVEPVKPLTTYLVVDGNQGQFVQVANEGPQPVTFRNQTGQILQATPINVVSAPTANPQPTVTSFPVNVDRSLPSNPLPPFEKNGSTEGGLSLAQIAQKVNQPRRRSSSSSVSKKKRGRPRLYERDPFTNKPKKSAEKPAVVVPPITRPAAVTNYNSIIFPRQTSTLPLLTTSLFPTPQYSYPSLLNNNTLVGSNFSLYSSPTHPPPFSYSPSATVFPHPSPAEPLKSLQTSVSSVSPRRSVNDDVSVHYIGGFVIRESSQPFSPKEKEEQAPPATDRDLPLDPGKWTVSDVGEFITRLTSTSIRDAFYESEIDGQALLLMTPEHLRETLKIKLGPSLIIASEIGKLRERAKTFSSSP